MNVHILFLKKMLWLFLSLFFCIFPCSMLTRKTSAQVGRKKVNEGMKDTPFYPAQHLFSPKKKSGVHSTITILRSVLSLFQSLNFPIIFYSFFYPCYPLSAIFVKYFSHFCSFSLSSLSPSFILFLYSSLRFILSVLYREV